MEPLGRYAIAVESDAYCARYWVIDTHRSTEVTPNYIPISRHRDVHIAVREARKLNRLEQQHEMRRAMVQAGLTNREEE